MCEVKTKKEINFGKIFNMILENPDREYYKFDSDLNELDNNVYHENPFFELRFGKKGSYLYCEKQRIFLEKDKQMSVLKVRNTNYHLGAYPTKKIIIFTILTSFFRNLSEDDKKNNKKQGLLEYLKEIKDDMSYTYSKIQDLKESKKFNKGAARELIENEIQSEYDFLNQLKDLKQDLIKQIEEV